MSEALPGMYGRMEDTWRVVLDDRAAAVGRVVSPLSAKCVLKRRLKSLRSLQDKLSRIQHAPGHDGELVKDLLGLRLVVPFLEDVEAAVQLLREAFCVLEVERKSEGLSFREFGYDAVHVVFELDSSEELELPERVLRGCEVQIRTYLQEAWAEVEHELVYKNAVAIPDPAIRKKLAALNASLMLSDSMFQEIRDHQRQQEAWGRARFHELRKKAEYLEDGELESEGPPTPPSALRDPAHRLLQEGMRCHNDHRYEHAVTLYTQAIELEPSSKMVSLLHLHRGMAHFMLDHVLRAVSDFSVAFECDPTNPLALTSRGLAWRHIGVVNQALADFAQSLEVEPNQPEVHFLMAQTFVELEGMSQEARRAATKAVGLDASHQGARDLLASLLES